MKGANPFDPNSVVSPNLFAGRTQQVLQVLRKLSQVKDGRPSSFFFMGERGIGKTALAKLVLFTAAQGDPDLYNLNLLPAYYSVEKGQNTRDVLQAVLNGLTDKMSPDMLSVLGKHLGNLLKNGKFSIGAFGGSVSIENSSSEAEKREVTVRDQVISILSNVISAVKADAVAPKDGLLFVIDEVNNLSDIENCAQLIRGIITTLDVRGLGFISFVLIGYQDTEKRFFEGDESARRQFDEVLLEPMPTQEASEILEKGFKSSSIEWDAEALRENINVTGGYPHSVQLIGHNLYEQDKDGIITKEDWKTAVSSTAIELQTKGFATMYSFHGKRGQREEVLDTLIRKSSITKSELAKLCGAKVNVYRLLPKLKTEGSIVEDSEERLSISSQLLRVAILFAGYQRTVDASD